MDNKSKSILLQVAFKAAVEANVPTEEQVITFYEMLLNLHDRFGITLEDNRPRTGGGNRGATRGTPITPKGETFLFGDFLVEDFRAAKADPALGIKANYPDFKTTNGQEIPGVTTPSGAAWMYDQDGGVNEKVKELVDAANSRPLA